MKRTPEQIQEDYKTYRGRCRELSVQACAADPTLTLVRGHYLCPVWGTEEAHWWTTRPDGTIFDPSARQFPSNGRGIYTPFNGLLSCSNCGKEMEEKDADIDGNYAFCSFLCHGRFVGVL